MPQVPLKLPVSSVIGRDGEVASARLINAYAEQIERDGKAAYVLYGAPGLTRFDQGSYIGAERGMIQLDDLNLIAVLGNQVVKVDVSGKCTLIGSIPGVGRVSLAKDREIQPTIACVTQDGRYFLISYDAATLEYKVTKQTIANLPSPIATTYLAGVFLYTIPDGRVFCSAIDDGTSVNAAAFLTANANPDRNVRGYAYNGYLYVFGKQTCEIWQADPALSGYPFPFSPMQQIVTLGLLAPYSIAELDNGLAFVDDAGLVRYSSGGSGPQRISTHTVERAIAGLSPTDQQAITGSVQKIQGHTFYTLTSPGNWTFVYDATPNYGFWHERKSYGMASWRVGPSVYFNGKYIAGDQASGKLYVIDPNAYTEDGNVHEMEVWCGVSHRFPGQMIADSVKIDVIGGVGLQTGNDADVNPVLMIDYSDDGGKTFEGETPESLGAIGQYAATVESFMWGIVREKGRIWRFRASINSLKGIIQAFINGRPARG